MASTLAQAAEMMHGTLQGADVAFHGVSTDTRTLQAGELFVALEGPSFDGRDFVSSAAEKSAAGVVLRGPTAETPLARISVADTRIALGELAAAWRRAMPANVVGLTGSNGKTTLKELTCRCLAGAGKTLATEGNLNNDIGVPLTLLRLGEDDEFAVIEMGANHGGEIAYLTNLVAPHVVAITNAGSAHLEGFGSLEGIARGKGEILQGSPRPRVAVLNADDDYFDFWSTLAHDVEVISFGTSMHADVRATDVMVTPNGSSFNLSLPAGAISVELPLGGRHNVLNAAAAAAIASALGIDGASIRAGLESVSPVEGRLKPLDTDGSLTLFDDSYNANPSSVIVAAEFLAGQSGERWLVLGDMAELGAQAAELHEAVGCSVRDAGIDRLFTTGELARHACDGFGDGAVWCRDLPELIAALRSALDAGDGASVLVKGSRSAGMERVVHALLEREGD